MTRCDHGCDDAPCCSPEPDADVVTELERIADLLEAILDRLPKKEKYVHPIPEDGGWTLMQLNGKTHTFKGGDEEG